MLCFAFWTAWIQPEKKRTCIREVGLAFVKSQHGTVQPSNTCRNLTQVFFMALCVPPAPKFQSWETSGAQVPTHIFQNMFSNIEIGGRGVSAFAFLRFEGIPKTCVKFRQGVTVFFHTRPCNFHFSSFRCKVPPAVRTQLWPGFVSRFRSKRLAQRLGATCLISPRVWLKLPGVLCSCVLQHAI